MAFFKYLFSVLAISYQLGYVVTMAMPKSQHILKLHCVQS